jgi:hypothetical protein
MPPLPATEEVTYIISLTRYAPLSLQSNRLMRTGKFSGVKSHKSAGVLQLKHSATVLMNSFLENGRLHIHPCMCVCVLYIWACNKSLLISSQTLSSAFLRLTFSCERI